MWEPVGPLPATVYWRRRWVAIASATTVIMLFTWGIAALATGGAGTPDEPETSRPASRAAVSAPQEASPPPAAPPFAALSFESPPSTAQPPTGSRPGAAGSTPPTPPTTGPEPVPSTSEALVPEVAPPTSSPPSTTPAPPAQPAACTNGMLAVRAEVDGTDHHVGERMLLRLVVTNSSQQPCVRDLDPVRQEIVVWSADGSQRLWSSNDCSSAKGPDLRTLAPGQPLAFSVRWAGRTSAPGCPAEREPVPAGEYRLLTRVDDVISPPTQFVRAP